MRSFIRKNRIYILPTSFGVLFLGGSMVMILIGATYQNNLVNLLAFFMLGLSLVAMVQTHINLKDVFIRALEVDDGFSGDHFVATVLLGNSSREIRRSFEAKLSGFRQTSVYQNFLPLTPGGTLALRSAYPARQRGRHSARNVKVSSTYPIGLFRAWVYLEAPTEYYIFPEPVGSQPLPQAHAEVESFTGRQTSHQGDDFRGHRRYQVSDSSAHIDWKAHARGRPLMVKEFKDGTPFGIVLDWYSLPDLTVEERLSQLSAWVKEAHQKRLPFAMRLPGFESGTSDNSSHTTLCLRALACYSVLENQGQDQKVWSVSNSSLFKRLRGVFDGA